MYIFWGKNRDGLGKKETGLLILLIGYKFECSTKISNEITFQEMSWNVALEHFSLSLSFLLLSIPLKVKVSWIKEPWEKAMENFLSNVNTMINSLILYWY